MLADANILNNLTTSVDPGFEEAYNAITHSGKAALRPLLIYFDKVWNYMLSQNPKGELRFTHLHFPEMDGDKKDIILEFIVQKQFHISLQRDQEQSTYIADRIKRAEAILTKQAPDGATGKSRLYKTWNAERTDTRRQLNVLRSIPVQDKSFRPDTILNLPQNDLEVLKKSLFTVEIDALKDEQERAYCLMNADKDINSLSQALDDLGILKRIRQIILFDCENRGQLQGYNKGVIDNLNAQGYAIIDLIICSFDKRAFRLGKLLNRVATIYQRNHVAIQPGASFPHSYIFYEKEIAALSAVQDRSMRMVWLGDESESFYDYLNLSREYEIDSLRSIGVLNIFSIAVNEGLAEKILKDLFSEDKRYDMFSDELRAEIKELSTGEQKRLRANITNLLTNVIRTWQNVVQNIPTGEEGTAIAFILPFQLVKMRAFRMEWRNAFPNTTCKLYAWNALRDALIKERTVYVLAYRDAGRSPFDLFPNVLEHDKNDELDTIGMFMKMFFRARYERFIYPYLLTWNKLLSHEFRHTNLQWAQVDQWISAQKIKSEEVLFEADDHEYGLTETAEMVRVEYIDNNRMSFYPSRQLIVRKKGTDQFKVIRADALLDGSQKYEVQPLDELYEDLNLFSITPEEKQELIDIKQAYGVMDDRELWKVLLAREVEKGKNPLDLYNEITEVISDKSAFVRFEHFRNHWLDPESSLLIPRRRRHFRSICEHLGLSGAYYRLKLKKRASLTSNSRQSNGQMNALLAQMLNEGLFGPDVDWKGLDLQHLMEAHELEEKGLNPENLNSELNALVDLLKDKIQLKEITKLELS